jgi:hypothetical protein
MRCNLHHYCEDCFCEALELAISKERFQFIPCGEKSCSRLEFKDVKAIISRFVTISATRRVDLLQRYADRLVLYNATDRTFCSKEAYRRFLPVDIFGFENSQRVTSVRSAK